MRIGELAKATDTPVETVRYYERERLLPQAPRTEGNYRRYDDGHVQRLTFIRHCRSLDMTLDEIRILLDIKDAPRRSCGDVDALLEAHIGHVAERIKHLRFLEKQLKAMRERCTADRPSTDCAILQGLSAGSRPAASAAQRGRHVAGTHSPRRD